MKLAIIIPAFNEEKTISEVLNSLPKQIDGISKIFSIVVDDGSVDRTGEISNMDADYCIKHVVNLGVGAATITGLEAAKRLAADVVVTLDADGQHNPNDIKKIIEPVVNKTADVVIGTRMLNPKGMPATKIFGNWVMNCATFLVFHKWSTDSQSGMKAFSQKALMKMSLHSIGYEICSEIIGEVSRNKLKYLELPIEVKYSDYSKFKGQNWLNAINIFTRIIAIKISHKK